MIQSVSTDCQMHDNALLFLPMPAGVLTHIALNQNEVTCIEIALIGLAERIRCGDVSALFAGDPPARLKAQLCYLSHWINHPTLRAHCRSAQDQPVWWPFTSSELVNWLACVCQSCIDRDAVFIMAACTVGGEAMDSASAEFRTYQHHYQAIVMTHQAVLMEKLAAIQAQGYPLFPTH